MSKKHDVRICPYCGSDNVRIQDTQMRDYIPWLYRRRLCKDCGHGYSTYEIHTDELSRMRKAAEKMEEVAVDLKKFADLYSDVEKIEENVTVELGTTKELAHLTSKEMDRRRFSDWA